MKNIVSILFLAFVLIGCADQDPVLEYVKKHKEVQCSYAESGGCIGGEYYNGERTKIICTTIYLCSDGKRISKHW